MTVSIILSGAILLLLGCVGFLIKKNNTPNNDAIMMKQQLDYLSSNMNQSVSLLHQQMSEVSRDLGQRLQDNLKLVQDSHVESRKVLQESHKHVGDRLDNAAKVVGDVQHRLGRVEEATQKVFEVGKDIASLQEILKAPKLRGSLGELFLGDLLNQVLPQDRFTLQYAFKSGEKVDAIIHSAQGMISIDSKFPLENFVRILSGTNEEEKRVARKVFLQDVKKHIDKISSKYILRDEGTLDFALMYIPAENVYYEILIKQDEVEKDLLRYAQDRRVFPVSPNSFYAYLQTISLGLKGLRIEEGVREVLDSVARLQKDFEKFNVEFSKVGTHLNNARGAYENADKVIQKFSQKLDLLGDTETAAKIGTDNLQLLKSGNL